MYQSDLAVARMIIATTKFSVTQTFVFAIQNTFATKDLSTQIMQQISETHSMKMALMK